MFAPKPTTTTPVPGTLAPDTPGFSPVFVSGIVSKFGFGLQAPINPRCCLSGKSALELAALLGIALNCIVLRDPLPAFSGAFQGSFEGGENPFGQVPWFALPDGTLLSCGLLADYWTHGYPAAVALGNAQKDIAMSQAMHAAGQI